MAVSADMRDVLSKLNTPSEPACGLPAAAYTDITFWEAECGTVLENTRVCVLDRVLRASPVSDSGSVFCGILGVQVVRRTDYPGGQFINVFVGHDPEAEFSTLELTHYWDQSNPMKRAKARAPVYRDRRRLQSSRKPRS